MPIKKHDCQHCREDYAMYCVNGLLWLCWNCYVKWSSEDA